MVACKARIRQIAASRTNQAYLDLMTDNATTRSDDNFADTLHFTVEAARSIGTEIAQAIKDGGLSR